MFRTLFLSVLTISLLVCLPRDDSWGRGRGGGGRSMGGGEFGGAGHSLGGAGGTRNMGSSGFSGGTGRAQGNRGGASLAEQRSGGANAGAGAGRGGQFDNSNRFSTESRSQLNGFLGLPSDGGLSGLSGTHNSGFAQRATGDNFDVNRGTAEGVNGGQAAGVSVTGPGGNTRAAAVGVGPDGGVARVGGVQGANGGQAVRGAAVGPDGGVVARGAAVGRNGGAAARGVAVGPNGAVAAGYARVSPAGRYTSAVAVRSNYNHWNMYGPGWYTNHPGAWFAAGMTADAIWRTATWNSVGAWMAYPATQPTYYDYGNNVAYQDGSVYVNGEDVGTSQQYYEQASQIAQVGAQADTSNTTDAADASEEGQWLPLGVFALTKSGGTKSDVSIQLAVNKQGIIRGNYTDTETGKTQVVQGSVDKQTQRVAFSVGDNTSNLIETGLYNLTKDEAAALVHVGKDKTEQWLLVRLNKPDADTSSAS